MNRSVITTLFVIVVAASQLGGSEADYRAKLKDALTKCVNQQVCCTTCPTDSSSQSGSNNGGCKTICEGDKSAPIKDMGKCEDLPSVASPSLRYRHSAIDYQTVAPEGTGCASCGAIRRDDLPGLDLYRLTLTRHLYVDTDVISSLGPSWGFNWDVWLQVYPSGSINRGHDVTEPGWQVLISQPMADPIDFFVATDAGGSGAFTPEKSAFFRSVVFYDAADAVVTDPTAATRAEYRTWTGEVFHFAMYEESPGMTVGRLVRYDDRNGNAVVVTYRYALDDPTMTGSLRLKLRIRDAITDPYGRSLRFVYDEDTIVGGTYVVRRIDLPNGESIVYRYGEQETVWRGLNLALVGIDHPDGTTTSIAARIDDAISCLRVDLVDPAAERATSHAKSVWFSTSPWINPDDPSDVRGQIFGRVRKIETLDGELVFAAWTKESPSDDPAFPGLEDRLYTYNQGRLKGTVHHDGDRVTAKYQRDADGSDAAKDPDDWSGWTKLIGLKPGAVKLGDDVVIDASGRVITYDRDPVTDMVRGIVHPDGSSEAYAYNGFQQTTRAVDRVGRVTTYRYDEHGNLLAKTVAVGTPDEATWSWTYWSAADAATPGHGKPGQKRTATDADGNTTEYVYHADGLIARVVEPADRAGDVRAQRVFTWDAAARLTSATDGAGRLTTYAYDRRNRIASASYSDGSSESWTYGVTGTDAGLLIAQSDRNGARTTMAYDAFGRLVSRTRAAGTPIAESESWTWVAGNMQLIASQTLAGDTTTFTYDERLRRVGVSAQPRSGVVLTTRSAYDVDDRDVIDTDPYGRRTFRVYDSDYRVVRTVRELVPGGVTSPADVATLPRILSADAPYVIDDVVRDAAGEPLRLIDGRGIATAMTYDGQGRVVARREADGTSDVAETTYRYDPQGNVVDEANARGFHTVSTYTGRNLRATTTVAAGTSDAATTTSTYTPTRKLASTTDALDRTTRYEYGTCCDRLVAVIDPLGDVIAMTYDPVGNRTSLTDANGNAVVTVFDARRRPIGSTNAAGETTTMTYLDDASILAEAAGLGLGAGHDGSAVITTDPTGARTIAIADGVARAVRQVDALGHARTLTYDALVSDAGGALVETTSSDALGDVTRQRADAAGRVRVVVDATGAISRSGFDADGNRVRLRDANGVGEDCTFDERNRRVACTDTAGATHSWTYDADSDVLTQTDALGAVASMTYDARDRRIASTDRIGATTTFTYDAVGNLLTITDAEGGTTSYAYDARDLLIDEALPAPTGGTRAYRYDAGRRLTQRVDQLGVATTYAYDHANRLVTRAYSSGAAADAFAYDAAGRLTGARSGRYDDTVARAYDAAGRVTEERLGLDGLTFPVGYAYDEADRVSALTYPSGSVVRRAYTPRNELASVSFAGSPVADRRYDAGGRLIESDLGNGVVEQRGYVPGENLVATIEARVPGSSDVVTRFAYAYDAERRTLRESDGALPDADQTFAYDAEGRLIDWHRGATASQAWNLSPVGDWRSTTRDGVSEVRTHTPVHEIRSIDGMPVLSDAKGNLTLQPSPFQTFAWDDENRLTTAGGAGPHGLFAATYRYDALGRRVQKRVNGETTTWVPAGAQDVVEIVGDPAKTPWTDPRDELSPPVTGVGPRGSLLQEAGTLHIDFRPDADGAESGWLVDTGDVFAHQGPALQYGWNRKRPSIDRGFLGEPEWDTFVRMMPGSSLGSWSIALEDGSYPVVIVMGDATSRDQTNTITVDGTLITDPTPAERGADGYEQGAFDAYTIQTVVKGGRLTIAPVRGVAKDPKLCFVEIGPRGGVIDAPTRERAAATAARMTAATTAKRGKRPQVREYMYGSYVDEPLAMTSRGRRLYYHANHLYTVAAVTDGSASPVERYSYDAYGHRTVLSATGVSLPASITRVQQYGINGRYHDDESGLVYVRARQLSPRLGRFLQRDEMRYVDGLSLYAAYFMPNYLDPDGTYTEEQASSLADADARCKSYCEQTHEPGAPYRLSFDRDTFTPTPGAKPQEKKSEQTRTEEGWEQGAFGVRQYCIKIMAKSSREVVLEHTLVKHYWCECTSAYVCSVAVPGFWASWHQIYFDAGKVDKVMDATDSDWYEVKRFCSGSEIDAKRMYDAGKAAYDAATGAIKNVGEFLK